MIKVEIVEQWHIDNLVPNSCYDGDKRWADCITGAPHGTYMYALVANGEVLAIMGCHLVWDGLLDIWAIISDAAKKYKIGFARAVERVMVSHAKFLGAKRLQMAVRCGLEINMRFAEFLGYAKEATLKRFGPEGDDYYIYARFM